MKVVVYAEYCKLSSVHMMPNFVKYVTISQLFSAVNRLLQGLCLPSFSSSEHFGLYGHFNGLGCNLDNTLRCSDVGNDHFHEVAHENCDACSSTLVLHHCVARAS